MVYYPEAINKYGKRLGGEFMVDDKEERERRIADGRKAESRLNNAIYGQRDSPLYDETMLRSVASAGGIEKATSDLVTADEVRNLLYASVDAGQKKYEKTSEGKGTDAFLEFIQYDDVIRARSLILEALDRKLVKYDMVRFTYIYTSTNTALLVVPEKHKARRFDYLCEYLLGKVNAPAWEKFRHEVISTDVLEKKDLKFVRWLCKEEGIPITAKSEENLRKALIERYP
jgi:hypothetical protein